MPAEAIRIKRTDLELKALQDLLRDVESDLFKNEKKRITGFTLAEPNGPDAGHNVIVIDSTPKEPPLLSLEQFPTSLNENQLAEKLVALEDAKKMRVRCYGTALVSGEQAVVAVCDPGAVVEPVSTETLKLRGRMSTFGGRDDQGVGFSEDLAWIEREQQAAAYPGFFLPGRSGEGFGHRLNTEKFYLACRWDYDLTPKGFLAQPTTLCVVTNVASGASAEARPIDFGPSDTKPGAKDRVADLSPGLAAHLGLTTDAICEVAIPRPEGLLPRLPGMPAPGAAAEAIPHGKRRVVFLTGDYVGRGRHIRQAQAKAERCALTVDFHFNSNGPAARGAEVYFKKGDSASKQVAQRIVAGFQKIGLPDHGDPVKASDDGEGRAQFIDFYSNPAVLLEPLFVSNPEQVAWLHDDANFKKLGEVVATAILASTKDGDTVGLSIGHLGKDSSPKDRGATCRGHDTEAEHGEALAHAVEKLIA